MQRYYFMLAKKLNPAILNREGERMKEGRKGKKQARKMIPFYIA